MLSPSAILDADAPVGEVIALPNESDSLSVNECVTTALTVTLPSIPSPATTAAAWSNAPGTTVYVTGLPPGPIATPSCRTVTEYVPAAVTLNTGETTPAFAPPLTYHRVAPSISTIQFPSPR